MSFLHRATRKLKRKPNWREELICRLWSVEGFGSEEQLWSCFQSTKQGSLQNMGSVPKLSELHNCWGPSTACDKIFTSHTVPGSWSSWHFSAPWMEQFCDWHEYLQTPQLSWHLKGVLKICSFFPPHAMGYISMFLHILASIRAFSVPPATWLRTNGAIKHLSRHWETGSTGNYVNTLRETQKCCSRS